MSWEPCYVAHFYHGHHGCDFMCLRSAKNMDEAWKLAQQEGRRRNSVGDRVMSICVDYCTEVRSGGVENE